MATRPHPYLLLRGSVWYFRRVIPKSLRQRLSTREFIWSLHTDSQRQAQRLALVCSVLVDELLALSATNVEPNATDRAKQQLSDFVAGLVQGDRSHQGSVARYLLGGEGGGEQSKSIPDKKENLPKGPLGVDTPPLLDAWREYEEERGPRWKKNTLAEYRNTIHEFTSTDFIGNKPVSQVTRKDLVTYRDLLARLPAQREKKRAYRSLSVAQLLEANIPVADRVSDRTINERLTILSSFFGWCKNVRGYTTFDVCFQVRIDRSAQEERATFNDSELATLFAAKVNTARKFSKAYKYWLPLLGYYTGARISELAQLHVDDLVIVDGVHCLRFKDDGESQSLKTANASRLVPLHPVLVRLGFPEYVAGVAKTAQRVFPDIRRMRNSWGTEPSKWFTRYRRSVGIPDTDESGRQKVFHSFRKTFVTRLRLAGVDVSLIQQLVGHARTAHGVTEIYTEGFGVRDCYAAVCRLPEALPGARMPDLSGNPG